MRSLFYFLLLLLGSSALAQLVEMPLYNYPSGQTAAKTTGLDSSEQQIVDTLTLPFLDDFGQSPNHTDVTKWLCEGGTLVNNRYAVNPPTWNVVTFDGVDSAGTPYAFPEYNGFTSTEINGPTDYLISFPIDLSGVTASDNLGFSFFWQKGGIDDDLYPNLEEGDSLGLYGWAADSTWKLIWPTQEVHDTVANAPFGEQFQYTFLSITDEDFFHAGFQFMFSTEGRQTGNYDIWSIDNVRLDTGRATEDRIQDVSMNSRPSSLLTPYRAMPLKQFKEDPISFINDTIFSSLSSIYNVPIGYGDSLGRVFMHSEDYTQEIYSSATDVGNFIDPLEQADLIWPISATDVADAITAEISDSFSYYILETDFAVDMPDDISYNDNATSSNVLENYFAYDDGSAEMAIGMLNYGEMAIEFELLVEDTILGIAIHFIQQDFDLDSSNSVTAKLWSSLNGVDGALDDIQVAAKFNNFIYQPGVNDNTPGVDHFDFFFFEFEEPVHLDAGKFYVGFEQNIPTRLPIGLDKSSNSLQYVYTHQSSGATWNQNFLETSSGNVMIRPIFGDPQVVGLAEKEIAQFVMNIFPNPSSGEFTVVTEGESIEVLDLVGNSYFSAELRQGEREVAIDLSHLQKGLYLIKSTKEGVSQIQKLVLGN